MTADTHRQIDLIIAGLYDIERRMRRCLNDLDRINDYAWLRPGYVRVIATVQETIGKVKTATHDCGYRPKTKQAYYKIMREERDRRKRLQRLQELKPEDFSPPSCKGRLPPIFKSH